MKNQFTITNGMLRHGRFGLALAGAMLLAIATSSSAGPAAEVLPPSSLPYGYSYEEWSAKYWQWSLAQSTNKLKWAGASGACAEPASRVWFLNGSDIPGASGGITIRTNKVTIPAETPLFFPILSTYDDNTTCPLSNFTTFTAYQLTTNTEGQWSAATETTCAIDGVEVDGLTNPTNSIYNVVSPPFSYTTAEKDNVLAGFFGEPCIPDGLTVYPAVADGVYLMVSPFPLGKHTIHYVGIAGPTNAPFVEEDLTFDIFVE
jgi:hypothetical protein